MRYIERVVWKPLDWYADVPSGHAADAPRSKPHGLAVDLGDGRMLMTSAASRATALTIGVTGGLRISIPAEKAPEVAEAILYAYHCAYERDADGDRADHPLGSGSASPDTGMRSGDH